MPGTMTNITEAMLGKELHLLSVTKLMRTETGPTMSWKMFLTIEKSHPISREFVEGMLEKVCERCLNKAES